MGTEHVIKNEKTMEVSEYLNIDGAAVFLNEKVSYLRSLVFQKKIPYAKVNKAIRFVKSDLISWYQTKKIKTNEEGV